MEKAIPFKLRNRSDINFDITDGDNKPVCIDKEYLPSDFGEGIKAAGSVYRFVLPGRDAEDFVEDVCYILGEIYDEGEVLSREELRNAFKDGFNMPPVHCATLFKDHGMCRDCPYCMDFVADNSVLSGINSLTPVTGASSSASDIITVSGREKNREFLTGAERSAGSWVAVEPCMYKGCTSLILYMPQNRCYFVCPISLYDSGYRLVAEKVLLKEQITKICSSGLDMACTDFTSRYTLRNYTFLKNFGVYLVRVTKHPDSWNVICHRISLAPRYPICSRCPHASLSYCHIFLHGYSLTRVSFCGNICTNKIKQTMPEWRNFHDKISR